MSAAIMEGGQSKQRVHLILNGKDQLFPEKLYDVANDGYLIKWNRNGSISAVEEELFENNVMHCYPGFLQIPSFVNFRRLFREYGFEWCYNQDGIIEFSHPSFVRGCKQLVSEIRTRRRSFLGSPRKVESSPDIQTDPDRRYPTRKRRKTVHFSPSESCRTDGTDSVDIGGGGDYVERDQRTETGQQEAHVSTFKKLPRRELDLRNSDLMKDFAKNEFNEEEYYEWLYKQRKQDETKQEAKPDDTIRDEYSWMYYTDPVGEKSNSVETENIGELVVNSLDTTTEEMSAPCGLCKCCMSMNNILNIETNFGIVQNNINPITDYVDPHTINALNPFNSPGRNEHSVFTSLT